VYSGDLMSNDVQSHESVVERLPGEERRASPRHAASTLGDVTARIIGGSPVDLVNFSARGVLFECDSRLLIGARASVRITTPDANLIVSGRVVRSRVKGLVNGALRYDAALALDHELTLRPMLPASDAAPAATAIAGAGDDVDADADVSFESELDGSFDPAPVEAYLAESEASLAAVSQLDTAEEEAIALFDGAPASDDAHVELAAVTPSADVHVEVAVRATLEEAEPAFAPADPMDHAGDAAVEAAEDEPIAFEADAGVTFEAADDFVFEEPADAVFEEPAAPPFEPVAAAEPTTATPVGTALEAAEPEGESMFDATPYSPPAEEAADETSMFESTPPMPVSAGSAASMFDARPSEAWRDAETHEPVAEATTPAADTPVADGIDFETDVAFEADDAVMFEPAFEADGAPVVEAPSIAAAGDVVEAEPVAAATEPELEAEPEPEPAIQVAPAAEAEPLDVTPSEPAVERAAADETTAAAPDDDRALMPFIATVPVDLADLRRIAADNQW
jgi:hypothetical protein